MIAITESEVRAVLEQLADPAFAGLFEDLLSARRTEMDEGEDPGVRRSYGVAAAALLDDLVGAVAAELGVREQVSA
jgi:hypothetical protein